jgi:hypothetical protein
MQGEVTNNNNDGDGGGGNNNDNTNNTVVGANDVTNNMTLSPDMMSTADSAGGASFLKNNLAVNGDGMNFGVGLTSFIYYCLFIYLLFYECV